MDNFLEAAPGSCQTFRKVLREDAKTTVKQKMTITVEKNAETAHVDKEQD